MSVSISSNLTFYKETTYINKKNMGLIHEKQRSLR